MEPEVMYLGAGLAVGYLLGRRKISRMRDSVFGVLSNITRNCYREAYEDEISLKEKIDLRDSLEGLRNNLRSNLRDIDFSDLNRLTNKVNEDLFKEENKGSS